MRSEADMVDSVMKDFFSSGVCFIRMLKDSVIENIGSELEGARIDFPDWNDADDYYHFKGVKIVECGFSGDFEPVDTVVLIPQNEFLKRCLYYIDNFKEKHPNVNDKTVQLAEDKIRKSLSLN